MPSSTAAEITRVLAPGKTVYLLGGASAIPASIATQLTAMGYVVSRISGSDRYSTAVAVADAMGDPSTVFLATAANYADALAAGPAAAHATGAILLTNGTSMPGVTTAYLAAHPGSTYAVGGPAATADPSASAISGTDRYATAALVAQQFFATPTTVGLASGVTFADALPAAAYLARVGGPLLLTDPNALPPSASSYLTAAQSGVTKALVFGGTSAVSTAAAASFSSGAWPVVAMVYVAVIGPGAELAPDIRQLAWDVGRLLAERGAVVVTGGLGGVMAAAAEGCAHAGGQSIGILPGADRAAANEALTLSIPTGLGELRNGLIVRSVDGVIAVGGSWGTLSELALAQRTGVPVVSIAGWTVLDAGGHEQPIERATSAEEAVDRMLHLIAPV